MLYIRIIALFIFLTPVIAPAQKHDYLSFFGYGNNSSNPRFGGMTVNFNNRPPRIYPEKKKIDFLFYCGACSDSTGHLMFYTNGISIRDTTHNKMLNGDTINPGQSWLEWKNEGYPNGPFCFAVPAPGLSHQYYFFHMATKEDLVGNLITAPFYWSLIDMKANNGLGKVVKKNQVLIPDGDLAAPVGVKHGNGRDWWVITGLLGTPKIFTFLLNPDGVHGPFEYEMPFDFPGKEYQSVNAMSPDGRTYIRCDGNNGLNVFDFDRCNGTFSNQRVAPFAEDVFGFATVFAPDSRHLYLSSWEAVLQVDITAPDIAATLDTLAYYDGNVAPSEPFGTGFWNPNLAPDGKIYYATTNGTLAMHVIHDPDLPGQAADLQQHGIALQKYNGGTMCLFPNYRLGEWEGSPCDTVNGQRPGDGFTKTPYAPPPVRSGGYTVLPPLGKPAPPGSPAPPRRPSMAELAREQRKAGEATTNQQLRTKE